MASRPGGLRIMPPPLRPPKGAAPWASFSVTPSSPRRPPPTFSFFFPSSRSTTACPRAAAGMAERHEAAAFAAARPRPVRGECTWLPDFAAPRPRSVRRGRSRPWSVRRHRSRLPAACPAPRLLARGRPGGDRCSQSAAVTASLLSARRRRPRPPLRALLGLLQQQLRSEARGWSTPCGSSTDSTTTPNADSSAPMRAPVQLFFYRSRDLRYCSSQKR